MGHSEKLKIRELQESEKCILQKLLYEDLFIPEGIEPPPFDVITLKMY